jgi:hypothetical protein
MFLLSSLYVLPRYSLSGEIAVQRQNAYTLPSRSKAVYHNVRHEEPPWQEFWRIAGMDGSGLAGMFLFTGGLVRRNKRRAIHDLP